MTLVDVCVIVVVEAVVEVTVTLVVVCVTVVVDDVGVVVCDVVTLLVTVVLGVVVCDVVWLDVTVVVWLEVGVLDTEVDGVVVCDEVAVVVVVGVEVADVVGVEVGVVVGDVVTVVTSHVRNEPSTYAEIASFRMSLDASQSDGSAMKMLTWHSTVSSTPPVGPVNSLMTALSAAEVSSQSFPLDCDAASSHTMIKSPPSATHPRTPGSCLKGDAGVGLMGGLLGG